MVNVCFTGKDPHNLFNMTISQDIVIGFFLKQPAGVNKLNAGIGFVLGQHQYVNGNGGAEEQIRCQRNHRFNIVVVDQVLSDFLLCTATVKNTGEADYCCAPFSRQVVKRMKHERKVSF